MECPLLTLSDFHVASFSFLPSCSSLCVCSCVCVSQNGRLFVVILLCHFFFVSFSHFVICFCYLFLVIFFLRYVCSCVCVFHNVRLFFIIFFCFVICFFNLFFFLLRLSHSSLSLISSYGFLPFLPSLPTTLPSFLPTSLP